MWIMKEGRNTVHTLRQTGKLPVEVNRFKLIMQLKGTAHKEICSSLKIINLMQLKPLTEAAKQQLFNTARQFYCRMENCIRNISHFVNCRDNELHQTIMKLRASGITNYITSCILQHTEINVSNSVIIKL
jgi:hypothetical protein